MGDANSQVQLLYDSIHMDLKFGHCLIAAYAFIGYCVLSAACSRHDQYAPNLKSAQSCIGSTLNSISGVVQWRIEAER